jgi:hypothetical protein
MVMAPRKEVQQAEAQPAQQGGRRERAARR